MLKITVRPEAIRNSSMPNRMPFSVEMTMSSSTKDLGVLSKAAPIKRCHGRANARSAASLDDPAIHLCEQKEMGARVKPGHDGVCGSLRRNHRSSLAPYGRSILQVVGSMVSLVSIFATERQPQPVFSSSNFSLSVRVPKDEI